MSLQLQVIIVHPSPVSFINEPPLHLFSRIIPQAEIAYNQQTWGYILLQELVINGISIGLYSFVISSNCSVQISYTKQLAVLQYALEGFANTAGALTPYPFTQHQHGLFYLPPASNISLHFTKGHYTLLQIHFPLSTLRKFSTGQPALSQFQQPDNSIPAFISPSIQIDKRLNNTLQQLTFRLLEVPFQAYYFNSRCMFLLMRFIGDYNQFLLQQSWHAKKEMEFNHLAQYIRNYFESSSTELLNTKALAKKTNLSVYQLKKICHKYYGLSPSELIIKTRMELAMSLLAQGKLSIRDISAKTKYHELSSFSRAFKIYYGYPPSHFSGGNLAE